MIKRKICRKRDPFSENLGPKSNHMGGAHLHPKHIMYPLPRATVTRLMSKFCKDSRLMPTLSTLAAVGRFQKDKICLHIPGEPEKNFHQEYFTDLNYSNSS